MDHWHRFRIPAATLKTDEASYEWRLGPDFSSPILTEEHEGLLSVCSSILDLIAKGNHYS